MDYCFFQNCIFHKLFLQFIRFLKLAFHKDSFHLSGFAINTGPPVAHQTSCCICAKSDCERSNLGWDSAQSVDLMCGCRLWFAVICLSSFTFISTFTCLPHLHLYLILPHTPHTLICVLSSVILVNVTIIIAGKGNVLSGAEIGVSEGALVWIARLLLPLSSWQCPLQILHWR